MVRDGEKLLKKLAGKEERQVWLRVSEGSVVAVRTLC